MSLEKNMKKITKKLKTIGDVLALNACNQPSPTKMFHCIRPKEHEGKHFCNAKVEWQKGKETVKEWNVL